MIDERERILRKERKKKILLVIVLVIIGILGILGIIMFILSGINSLLREESIQSLEESIRPPSYIFAEPNYDENIFDDSEYMGMDRAMKYTVEGVTISITENNYSQQTPIVQFMYDSLQYIINGDCEKYNEIFTDEYLNKIGDNLRETFTMQKLYDIDVELANLQEEELPNGRTAVYSDFVVRYKIKNNNGTFRNDLPDGARIPMVYLVMTEVDKRDDIYESSVYDIVHIYQYTSDLYE